MNWESEKIRTGKELREWENERREWDETTMTILTLRPCPTPETYPGRIPCKIWVYSVKYFYFTPSYHSVVSKVSLLLSDSFLHYAFEYTFYYTFEYTFYYTFEYSFNYTFEYTFDYSQVYTLFHTINYTQYLYFIFYFTPEVSKLSLLNSWLYFWLWSSLHFWLRSTPPAPYFWQ